MTHRPAADEYAPYYEKYVSLVPGTDILSILEKQIETIQKYAAAVSAEREKYRYAEGKWSIREVFGHMIDGEWVFGYRALCISRGETAPLPSFDENGYVDHSNYANRELAELCAELVAVRRVNLMLLRTFDGQNWERRGTASGKTVSARALAFLMAGHILHHLSGLHNNYGILPRE